MRTRDEAPALTARHPLDPLDADEIAAATAVLRREGRLGERVRVHAVALREPPKAAVLDHREGDPLDREVAIVLRDRDRRLTCEALVSVTHGEVRGWRERTDVQPPLTIDELLTCESTIKADPQWQAAMRRRGIENLELAMVDPWPLGYNGPEDAPERGRAIYGLTWVRVHEDDNGYARPVENLVVRFDLDDMRVVEVDDREAVPLPPLSGNYSVEALADTGNFPHLPGGTRAGLRPLDIAQPEGPSFTVRGHEVEWQRWRFRVGFTQREGLVLHMLSFQDGERWRPVVYRASLSEMYIPYGDPGFQQYRKNVFDMGEFGLGIWTNSLELGCDCLGEIRYFDAAICDDTGTPQPIKNAICMHEEDSGILWKHLDFRSGATEVRRSRRLVVSSIVTVGNYEYGFYWYLYQDGSIEYEIKLSGIISNGALAPGQRPAFGTAVAPGVYGPNHQHFFNVRLDTMVDGPRNSVVEVNCEALPAGPDNPSGNAWAARRTPLARESEAQRLIDPLAGRYWRIENPAVSNAHGDPVAYKLVPGENTGTYFHPGAHGLNRAGFVGRHLWVTAFDPDQLHAAGQYPNQHPGGDGLPAYAAADRPLEEADLVVWYTFGAQHVPRPEDWPVMPAARIGFHLKPVGFFDSNPALDLPRPAACHHEPASPNGSATAPAG
jgi:primary-amine oxidase